MQSGIELLGARGRRADLEVLAIAIEALSRCVPNFRIELGHAGFFKAIAAQLPIDDAVREDIRQYIEAKTMQLWIWCWTNWEKVSRSMPCVVCRVCLAEKKF